MPTGAVACSWVTASGALVLSGCYPVTVGCWLFADSGQLGVLAETEDEELVLLDPVNDRDVILIDFDETGLPTPATDGWSAKRVMMTRDIMHLDAPKMVEARQSVWRECERRLLMAAEALNVPERETAGVIRRRRRHGYPRYARCCGLTLHCRRSLRRVWRRVDIPGHGGYRFMLSPNYRLALGARSSRGYRRPADAGNIRRSYGTVEAYRVEALECAPTLACRQQWTAYSAPQVPEYSEKRACKSEAARQLARKYRAGRTNGSVKKLHGLRKGELKRSRATASSIR